MAPFSTTLRGESIVLVFGPHDTGINEESVRKLRSTLLSTPDFQWILEVLTQLPQVWESVCQKIPELANPSSKQSLKHLVQWLRRGSFPEGSFPLSNVLVTPLVVVTQLTQYITFLKQLHPELSSADSLPATLKCKGHTIGLCTGLLTSAAVASSETLTELRKYGAAAIRAATAIGALVDTEDVDEATTVKWKSLAVKWTARDANAGLPNILAEFPNTYIPVLSDENSATITTPKINTTSLLRRLRDSGFIASEIGLQGQFHQRSSGSKAESLIHLFDSDSSFQFEDASRLAIATRSATGGDYNSSDKLHQTVTRAMLFEQADWNQLYRWLQSVANQQRLVVAFGHVRYIPQWLVREFGTRIAHGSDIDLTADKLPAQIDRVFNVVEDEAIAVVGMACHVPGGDDLEGFWKTICAGQSQHSVIPEDRINFQTAVWRDYDAKKNWYGNFVQDHDAFDHKFFKKSSREMASTDPQQRLIMQVGYQAVEQSGYFNMSAPDMKIGCYVGIGIADYETNVAGHPATAYTATGNLKSFAAGKISHHFGWTGPGVSVDTACSSSAVAVHYACQAILSGECTSALAGGTNVLTGPEWFQNLEGAAFLSQTGQCKPFDEKADGYCRGEGAGAVFLKKLSDAIKDGNQVLGVISATAVNQNENCSAITAPSSNSLSDVFEKVIHKAGLEPQQISVVEAHGTGTQVGDKAEYESIRTVLGGPSRTESLNLGSVKGLIGHLESASGIAAVIKTLLMMSNGAIPPQSSHQVFNPKLKASPVDQIEISLKQKAWTTDFKAALINNYGASGSNASMVITQAPSVKASNDDSVQSIPSKRPFWLCGLDQQSLRAYANKLLQFLKTRKNSNADLSIANLAFQVFRQSNRTLGQALLFSCSSVDELEKILSAFTAGQGDISTVSRLASSRPVILCFGGQVSTFIGLDREAYEHFKVLRYHLDECNETCLSLGLDSIYPAIFEQMPAKDTVSLQTMLFSLQYSCAKSWIDSGLEVSAMVGHSFGELTALCVSGTISRKDALKMVADRARVIQEKWGSEKGSMMAVEGAQDEVERLLRETGDASPEEAAATIACFNGPRSFTLAGSTKAIKLLRENLTTNPSFSGLKGKELNVTNAFHSTLVDSFTTDLQLVGEDLIIRKPAILLERATKESSSPISETSFIATHLRNPVYFNQAVQRLAQRFSSGIWLEAGSGSGVTTMASRALGSPKDAHFQPINITGSGAIRQLTDATLNLWKQGLNTVFWEHHAMQTSEYSPLLLPPYQFERARHWLEKKKLEPKVVTEVQAVTEAPKGLWTFLGYQDAAQIQARFLINTNSERYLTYVTAHVIAQTAPICPSTFQHGIAIDALRSLIPEAVADSFIPELQDMESCSPMCIDESRSFWLDATSLGSGRPMWNFTISSAPSNNTTAEVTVHASGRMIFRALDDASYEFAKYERLADRQRALGLLSEPDVDQIVQGSRNIYKAFSIAVQYKHEEYQGMQKITSKGDESGARIVREKEKEAYFNVGLNDTFCQAAGFYWNCMIESEDSEIFLSNKVDQWFRSPSFQHDSTPRTWELYMRHSRISGKAQVSDVFVFDSASGKLAWVILGLRFVKVPLDAISRLLARLSPSCKKLPATAVSQAVTKAASDVADVHLPFAPKDPVPTPATSVRPGKKQEIKQNAAPQRNVVGEMRDMLCELLGLDACDIKLDSDLVEIGIDSLLAMEVAREVENTFKTKLDTDELMALTDFQSLVTTVQRKLGISDGSAADAGDDSESDSDTGLVTSTSASSVTNDDAFEIVDVAQTKSNTPESQDIAASVILNTFGETKKLTDQFIEKSRLSGYSHNVLPKHNELVIVHIVDAFEQMGCSLRTAGPGQALQRVKYLAKHEQVMEVFYDLLEKARLVDLDGSSITRTAIAVPSKSAETLLQELVREHPDHGYDFKLTSLIGRGLGDCLMGKVEGTQLLFGTAEGRELAAGWYGTAPANTAWIGLMEHFWSQLLRNWPKTGEPIRILEMGAGTGGTTSRLAPIIAESGVPFQYTVTDISPSLVAGLRKRFKKYPNMRFEVMNLEKAPPADFLHSQHAVLATNCVHATQSLAITTTNIHKYLRPDGFLLMLEMTQLVPWIDLVFGVVEGWWAFNDGRKHALVEADHWQSSLQSNGYGHVDWSEGLLPESSIQRIIIGLASGPIHDRVHILPKALHVHTADIISRQAVIDSFVEKYARDFFAPTSLPSTDHISDLGRQVVITGATGSLGSHLVAYFAAHSDVSKVICLNRVGDVHGALRQRQALESRGISLTNDATSKLRVLETDTSKPMLGLSSADYKDLAKCATDFVHNAWPMSLTRAVRGFEPQFKTMRNLIDLARECSCYRKETGLKIGFQLVSSVAVVGNYPNVADNPLVPEGRMDAACVLPIGYAEAKLICEHMLDETLHRYPDDFHAMAVRVGQIAGSKTNGYWNTAEHLAQMIKSSQTLKVLPHMTGALSWFPANDVAATFGELLFSESQAYPIYHLENPVRQPWPEMIMYLAEALGMPQANIVPYDEWVRRVRQLPPSIAALESPAARLADFFDKDFRHMSSGGLILDTRKSREHSATLANAVPVGRDLVFKYIQAWKTMGFLR